MKVCSLESFKFFILRKKKEVRESTNIIWESCTWAWQPSIGMWHNVGTKCLLLGPWSVLLLCNYFIIGALICNQFHLNVNTQVNTPVMSCNYFSPRNVRHMALYSTNNLKGKNSILSIDFYFLLSNVTCYLTLLTISYFSWGRGLFSFRFLKRK